ncbi:hypothetical protein [Rhodanobacter sp. FW106-PBR-R2A-1-13]|uniref:hypothetical protein n=1 Tax=Rhodanobacter sp. FW106-PBR-R2A-1-13 TaxID=3454845 RepID=UPI0034E5F3A5
MNRLPISNRDNELLAMPPIDGQFPVTFDDGTVWTAVNGACRGCGIEFGREAMHGAVWRSMPGVAEVEAVALCHPCHLLTRFRFRLHPYRRLSWHSGAGWVQGYAPLSWLARLRRCGRAILHSIHHLTSRQDRS